jgi:hypothetical protein
LVGLFLLLPLGAWRIRETLRFTSVSQPKTCGRTPSTSHQTVAEKRNAYRILVEKPEGKRPLRRPRSRRVDNIKIDLREIEWDGMDWIDLA